MATPTTGPTPSSRARVGFLATAALCALAPALSAQDAADAQWKTAYARVNGVAVLRTAVDANSKQGVPPASALQQLISIEVLRQNLLKAGRDPQAVPAKDLDEALAQAREQIARNKQSLEEILERTGQTLEQFREGMRVPLAFRAHLRSKLTDERLRKVYAERKLALAGELRVSHLFVKVSKAQPIKAARAKLDRLRKALGAKPTLETFSTLASSSSEDSMASLTGGDLDWLRREGSRTVPGELVAAAFAHGKPGLLPAPVRSPRGLHLIFVAEVRLPPSATYERLRPKLLASLEREDARHLMVTWRKAAQITYAPDAPKPKQR